MSRIDKLRISGIRSFGPDNPQHIRFTPPLTLILGQNGCGKTTIIESLKYITTGEMPPGCSRGASFIHDPKIAREMVVRGQIRLRVIAANGEKVDFVRSMEATQKARTLEFKSLDQTITRVCPDGKIRHANNKCVDFMNEMINVIGVSNPILENVIFCHLEESNWPLDENKKVKDKFDAIFNATKYIKCLETMRKLRLEKKKQMKNMQETLASLRDMKEIADQKKDDLSHQQGELQEIKDEQEQANQKKVPLLKRIREIEEVENRLAQVSQDLGRKESKITMLQESNDQDAAEQSHQIEFSDDELHRRIAEYQATMSLKKAQIHKVQRHITEAEKEVRLVSAQQTEEQRILAKLEAEHEQHQARLQQRNTKAIELVKRDIIPALKAYSGRPQLTEEEAERALVNIGEHIRLEEERIEVRSADLMKTEDALQTSLNTLSGAPGDC